MGTFLRSSTRPAVWIVLPLAAALLIGAAGCTGSQPAAAQPGPVGLALTSTAAASGTATVTGTARPTDTHEPTLTPSRMPPPTKTRAATRTPAATGTPMATRTPRLPTATQPPTTATAGPVGDPLACSVPNLAWTDRGRVLRGGAPDAAAVRCLAEAGVSVLVDQRTPAEAGSEVPDAARAAGIEYINLGLADDTAPSPSLVQAWVDTVRAALAQNRVVLVHDRAGRGRMGVWDAVYAMLNGAGAQQAIEDRYLARAFGFNGAKISCDNGGNGQVQALAELGQALTGQYYLPAADEYGTAWPNCPRPAYMDGWSYAGVR